MTTPKKADKVIPAMPIEAKIAVCESIALNTVNTERRVETITVMEDQLSKMQAQLKQYKSERDSSYKALIAQIKSLHKDKVDFGPMPKGKKIAWEKKDGRFVVPVDAGIGAILFHKYVEQGLAEGSAYNMTMLLKFSVENGVMPELGMLNYTKFLQTAQTTGLPCLTDGKTRKAFVQSEKGKYTLALPKIEEPKQDTAGKQDNAGKPANVVVPKIIQPRASKSKSFVDNLLAAMVDDQGFGSLLLAYLAYVDGQGVNPNTANEAFVLFIEVMENQKHIVNENGKVSKLIP